MSNPHNDQKIPLTALLLGLGGLLPFLAAAASQWTEIGILPPPSGLTAALAYGAVILSFLGGIRWGTALAVEPNAKRSSQFALSVLPSLAGWAALLMTPPLGLSLLIAGFLLQALWDVLSVEKRELPRWFGTLRMILTAGAVLSLFAVLLRMVSASP